MDEFMGWKQETSMRKERKKKKRFRQCDRQPACVTKMYFFGGGSFLFI